MTAPRKIVTSEPPRYRIVGSHPVDGRPIMRRMTDDELNDKSHYIVIVLLILAGLGLVFGMLGAPLPEYPR